MPWGFQCWICAGIVFCLTPSLFAAETTDGKRFTQKPEVLSGPPTTVVKDLSAWAKGPVPNWIWGASDEQNYILRQTFAGGVKAARLRATADNGMKVFINGKKVAESSEWNQPVEVNITPHVRDGENEIVAEVTNGGGPAGFLAKLALTRADGTVDYIITDTAWKAGKSREDKDVVASRIVKKSGEAPWGDIFTKADVEQAEAFQLLPGFQVERLFTVPKDELGSWVNITVDPQGRLIVSDQGDKGLCRITPPPIGSQEPTVVDRLDVDITGAQGFLFAFDSLYVCVNGGKGSGLYRVRDTNGDDQFDEVKLLKAIRGGGEHGPHALRLSPDGKSIVVVCGNHTLTPFDRTINAPIQTMGGMRTEQLKAELPPEMTSRMIANWDEDSLLPRQWDAGGHAVGVMAPGGWIAQTDPDGKHWEIISSGYRNQFDAAYNADGELMVYDADMEWDYGMPWYRPTRVTHATSGSEFGWRSGTPKFPPYYPDSLPPAVEIGPGSPVGVEFGYGAKFPGKYQQAMFICDWTFGTMYAIHFQPQGSSYIATKEEFVARAPLPLTDVTIGKDGAMYFTIGGRGTQSELFRVTYVGQEPTAPVETKTKAGADLRALRHELEQRHVGPADPKQVPYLVKYLGHEDRFIRYAARIGLERIPVDYWASDVLKQQNAEALITGVIGLARTAEKPLQAQLITALDKLDPNRLSVFQQLEWLRAYQLVLIRLGAVDDTTRLALGQKFDALFPSPDRFVNRELAILMVGTESPLAAKKLVPLLKRERETHQTGYGDLLTRNKGYAAAIVAMLANQPDAQQIHYAFVLRNLKSGWTPELRQDYFTWFQTARTWSGGNSYQKFLTNIDNDAFTLLSEQDRLQVESTGARKPYLPPELPKPHGPGRAWVTDDVLQLVQDKLVKRDVKEGRRAFEAARCIICHRFAGDGGATGPDLTQAGGRFSLKDLTEAIIDPNKVISDQYKATVIETSAGQVITGRIVTELPDRITLVINPEDATKTVTIATRDIESRSASAQSLMPKDLINGLNEQEVLDLLAYTLSRGDASHAMFKK